MPLPNILLIVTDQMRGDALGCAGNPAIITPTLDRLATEGTIFERAYCASMVCTPSRAALMTGRYPQNTGAWNIGVSLREDEQTIADHFNALGYICAAAGKVHLRPQLRPGLTSPGEPEETSVRDRPRARDGTFFGFDTHFVTEDSKVGAYLDWLRTVAPQWVDNLTGDPGDSTLHEKGSILPPELHQTHWIVDRTIDVINQHDTTIPLFMFTSFVDPHHPFDAPRRYVDLYDEMLPPEPVQQAGELDLRPVHLRFQGTRGYWPGGGEEHGYSADEIRHIIRNYYAMITFIDEQIGRILAALDARGMSENTLIVFTSDHGELLGDHGLIMKGPWPYECLTRVPMIMQGPGVPSNSRVTGLMENLDVLPTLLDLIDQPVPYGIQGVSQVPAMRDPNITVRDSAITAYNAQDRGINIKSLRTDRYKLNLFGGEIYGELYDLDRDPHEHVNCFFDEAYQPIRAQMMERLAQRLLLSEDPLPERFCNW
jgi:arylsulfatase